MDATIQSQIEQAVAGVQDQPAEVKAAVGAAAATAAIPAPTPAGANQLWKFLVIGLIVLLLVSLYGIIKTVADGKTSTSPDVIVTVFSSVLTGLVGLFVKSPTQS